MIDINLSRILVVVAHPDDELLGLGGTLHRLIENNNCKVRCVILGEGITSRSEQRDRIEWQKELEIHRSNIYSAKEAIGYESLGIYDFPDNRFDSVDLLDIIKTVELEKNHFEPDIIFTHHGGDLNIDHRRTFESVITACRPIKGESVKKIIAFETPSGTEWKSPSDPFHFLPNMFVRVKQSNIEAKIQAMECYSYEKREFPHPRSPESLRINAQKWGISIGCDYAEAFQIIRAID